MRFKWRSVSVERFLLFSIAIVFIIWSAIFIYRSSGIGIDGKRYFCLFDDAMISMRYAWNLAQGNGLVWNVGERVEGYTNLLMTLVMAVSSLFLNQSNAVLAVQALGVLILLGSGYIALRIADLFFEDSDSWQRTALRLIAFTVTLFYYPLSYWTLMGMETGLLTLLLMASVWAAFRFAKTYQNRDLIQLGLFSGLAYLARPDAVIFSGILFVYVLVVLIQARRLRSMFWRLAGSAAILGVFIGGQLLFRWLYYGEWVPNTYVLKMIGMPIAVRLQNGFEFTKPFIQRSWPLMLIVLIDLIFNFHKQKLVLTAMAMAIVAYQVWVGGDAWPYWRMMSPVMPMVLLLFGLALLSMIDSFSTSKAFQGYFMRNPLMPRAAVPGFIAVVLAVAGLALADYGFRREVLFLQPAYQVGANKNNINIALALKAVTTENATVGVTWGGTVPYYSERKAVDFLGKSDKFIAALEPDISGAVSDGNQKSRPGHNKYDLSYSLQTLKPTYAMVFTWGGQDYTEWGKENYRITGYKGVSLRLLRNSPDVRWELLKN